MYDATVILDTPSGERIYAHQLVRPLSDGPGITRFCWHAGDQAALMAATRVRLITSTGTVMGDGPLAHGKRPFVHGDHRLEFELAAH